jgi:uncharacterized membrane protein (UPF0127 family)
MRRVLVESARGASVCVAEVADGHWTRFWGLLGRKHLPEGLGLWIQPSSSVHTCFMKFPIDLVYLSSENDVVKTCSRVAPGRLSFGGRGAKTVLELPAGALERIPLSVGERVAMRPFEGTMDSESGVSGSGTQTP